MQRFTTEWAFVAGRELRGAKDPLAPSAAWRELDQRARDNFRDEADWLEIRRRARAGGSRPALLVTLAGLCRHLKLSPVEVYALMACHSLPSGFLCCDEWLYNLRAPGIRSQAPKRR
jgi:hypothetical protein